jgi:Putative zinc-finger
MSDAKHQDEWQQHENVWLLLPWYANGTLEAAERTLVQEHLGGCPACREELARCGGLAAALAAGPENAPSPHPIQLARLMERVEASERERAGLDDEDGEPVAGGRGGGEPVAGGPAGARAPEASPEAGAGRRRGARASLLRATPVAVRWVLAGQVAALLALVLLTVTFAFGPARPGPRYVTLSAPSPAAVRPQVRLIFSETATGKEIRDVLLRTGGRLVDGPSPIGAYTLELAAADSPGSILAYLRAQRIVRFAEPVAGAPWPAVAPGGGAAPSGGGGSPGGSPP